MVHGLEAEYWGQVHFIYLDREARANKEVTQEFQVVGQPVFFFLAPDGTIIQRWSGYVTEGMLREAFDSYLSSAGDQ